MVHQGKFVKGWFHSNAAGKTATPKEGLNYKKGDPPYIKSVESPDDSP
jgi:stage II sporulation protein D